MKISKINGFGSFGVYVDDLDFFNLTEDEWQEVGKLFISEMLVVCRNVKTSKSLFLDWTAKYGTPKANIRKHLSRKYGSDFDATRPETYENLDIEESDLKWLRTRKFQLEESGDGRFLTKVYGKYDDKGNALGYFSSGDVGWHSNEGYSLTFSPAVALQGWEHMKDSATSFLQTVDLFESFTEGFRSELKEMVLIHEYRPGEINNNELSDPMLANHMRMAFCPQDGHETPLVCTAPNGRQGLHYSINSRARIKGMSQMESDKIFKTLDELLFTDKWIFDSWYSSDRDMLLFDNSVTLHRRLGGHPDRKAFRIQLDVSPLLQEPWLPWQHDKSNNEKYIEEINDLVDTIGGDLKSSFKLPGLVH